MCTPIQSRRWSVADLFAPVDIASLVFFRIGFGAIAAWWAWDYLTSGRVRYYYVEPQFHFPYQGFEWVQPLPGAGMYLLFLALAITGLAIAAGFFYHAACLVFAAGLTYVFLLDATNYQNHYYLMILLACVMALVPANRAVSVDAVCGTGVSPVLSSSLLNKGGDIPIAPAWSVWLVRFHVALPYVFGGIAKLDRDWLSGIPMRQLLAPHGGLPVMGTWLTSPTASLVFAYGGLAFDLAIVPLLLWHRTRAIAFAACVLFHVTNAALFPIHVFPWFMIFASTIFFEPDWLRQALGGQPLDLSSNQQGDASQNPGARILFLSLLAACCVFHVLWPLRHFAYPGNVNWTEEGHYFSWRMMLRNKTAGVRYYVTDTLDNKTWHPDLRPLINPEQAGKFSKDPVMIAQLGKFVAELARRDTGHPIEVRALVLMSLNGRKPQLYLDHEVDVARVPLSEIRRHLVPLTEPLRPEPWDLPLNEWEQHLELPTMPKAERRTQPTTQP